jgi:hypothetical protein
MEVYTKIWQEKLKKSDYYENLGLDVEMLKK